MSEQWGATPIDDTGYGGDQLWWWLTRLQQRFEYWRYVDRDVMTLKTVALGIILLLVLRLLFLCVPLFFPSADLRARAKRKKKN